MSTIAARDVVGTGLPVGLLLAIGIASMAQFGLLHLPDLRPTMAGPDEVLVEAQASSYRAAGEFQLEGAPVDGPLLQASARSFHAMRYQVTVDEYALCVADGACDPAESRGRTQTSGMPVIGVSYQDAEAYAAWISGRTGQGWRLPTIEEWTQLAGERVVDPALAKRTDSADPAERWLAAYEKEASGEAEKDAVPRAIGSFGSNSLGIMDIGGNVWEWTATCAGRTTLDADGSTVARIENCGVHYLEGRHRAAMSFFVKDARGGGCSAGVPPDNLGFRLIRDASWLDGIAGAHDLIRQFVPV